MASFTYAVGKQQTKKNQYRLHRLHAVCAGVYTRPEQTEVVMSKEMRLTVPATVTVHLDDAIGQLGELKELLSLLGHTFQVEVEIERDRQIDELDRRILGDAKMVAPHPAFRP